MAYGTALASVSCDLFFASPSSPIALALFSVIAQSPRENDNTTPYHELIRGNSCQSESFTRFKNRLFGKIFSALKRYHK